MKFNIFKRKEKEIISGDNDLNSNDIVDDFGSFVSKKMSDQIETESAQISSFKNNYSEGIGNSKEIITTSNNTQDEPKQNITNNFDSSYNDEITSVTYNDNISEEPIESFSDNIQAFNPYLNDMDKYSDLKETEEINQNPINNQNSYSTVTNDFNEVTNNIYKSEDVNVALSNIYNNSKAHNIEKEQVILDNVKTNTTQNVGTTPIIENDYKNSDVDPGYRICPKCGQKIREDYKQCFVCGSTF